MWVYNRPRTYAALVDSLEEDGEVQETLVILDSLTHLAGSRKGGHGGSSRR